MSSSCGMALRACGSRAACSLATAARRPRTARRGTVLLVVAGFSMLVMGLGLAFLLRMRVESDENQALVHDLQARVMLMAGCDYVLECARVGYDAQPEVVDPTQNARTHAEAFGWIDVRPKFPATPDGVAADPDVGPRDAQGRQLWSDVPDTSPGQHPRWRWPRVGSAARCPMHVMRQPPYATATTASYNPMIVDVADPAFGKPYLRWPDPQPPAQTNGWPSGATDPVAAAARVNAAQYGARGVVQSPPTFAGGDPRPRPETTGLSWFRVYRESPSVFVITCGAGGSLGFRDWDDVTFAPSHADEFGNDRALFEQILAEETRLWYRIEWCDATGAIYLGGFLDNEIYPASYPGGGVDSKRGWDHWLLHPVNSMQRSAGSHRNDLFRPNHCGTIRWVQRLEGPPAPPASDPGAIAW